MKLYKLKQLICDICSDWFIKNCKVLLSLLYAGNISLKGKIKAMAYFLDKIIIVPFIYVK